LNEEPFIASTLARHYPKATVDAWIGRNNCPMNDKLCEEAVWFTQTMLLGGREDMQQIATAINRIRANAAQIAKT
jgi:hypothetical protein